MKVGIIGAGHLGSAIAMNLHDSGHEVSVYNRSPEKLQKLAEDGLQVTTDLTQFVQQLHQPRVIWMLVPSDALEEVFQAINPLLSYGDILMDGSNAHYRASRWRYERLKERGIGFLDVGISGGVTIARNGTCLMVGGDEEVVRQVERLFIDSSVEGGYAHLGSSGAGHFAKMVHNGIEYGMMQAIGEGLELMHNAPVTLNKAEVTRVWNSGSLVAGTLMSLTHEILAEQGDLEDILPIVDTSGEACFTLQESIERKIPIPVIAASLFARYKTKDASYLGEKMVAALRGSFGGHKVYKKGEVKE